MRPPTERRVGGICAIAVVAAALAACGVGSPGAPDAGEGLWFEEIGAASGIVVDRVPADGLASLPDRFSGGVCPLDVDGRSPLDLFFALRRSAGSRSLLFVGRGPLDYAEESAARGLGDVGDALGCLAFDADGDGDDDLLTIDLGEVRLYRNDGGGFVRSTALPALGLDPRDILAGAAAGDVDGDGDVDVVVAGYVRAVAGVTVEHLELAPALPDLLLLSDGFGGFTVATSAFAPDLARGEPTLAIEILDLDGRPPDDIHVGNDLGGHYPDRALVHGVGEPLRDEAPARGLAYDARGSGVCTMGLATADIDGDGYADHLSTSLEGEPTAVYFCGASYVCVERGALVGTFDRARTFRWGVALADLDLDGDLDLFESTGHLAVSGEVSYSGDEYGLAQMQSVMLQDGDGVFVAFAPPAGDGLAVAHVGRGLAAVDLDDDGRMDFVVAPTTGPAAVLHDVRPRTGHWLRVVLRGRGENSAGLGAVVRVHTPVHGETRQHILGGGTFGNHDPRMHFGLPDARPVDVEVHWPAGVTTTLTALPPDREVVIAE